MIQVTVIDSTDEMYQFVGEVYQIQDNGKLLVYFDDVADSYWYDREQLEEVVMERKGPFDV